MRLYIIYVLKSNSFIAMLRKHLKVKVFERHDTYSSNHLLERRYGPTSCRNSLSDTFSKTRRRSENISPNAMEAQRESNVFGDD